jgi:hypothetical protein
MLARAMEVAGTVDNTASVATALHKTEVTQYPGRALDLTFTSTNEASYSPQMGYLEGGKTSYQEITLGG